EIWAPTQNPGSGQVIVAKTLGIDRNAVTVHMMRSGGAIGRRLLNDYMAAAALISKTVAAPVKLLWNRADDFQHDFYRPAGFHYFQGGVDDNGVVAGWKTHFITFPGRDEEVIQWGDMATDEFPAQLIPHFTSEMSTMPL